LVDGVKLWLVLVLVLVQLVGVEWAWVSQM